MKDWFYNEFKQVGVDYTDKASADHYDVQMDFRDYDEEVKRFVDRLAPADARTMTAIDLGCGTGAFSVHAARYFRTILAVDVSREMQSIAETKAREAGIANIEFHRGGFLGFRPAEPADVVTTKWALHHLPDYWKQAALLNVNRMLKPGGFFCLTDVIFPFDPDFEVSVQSLLDGLARDHGQEFADETALHIREEYSTFDWVITGMLERAGFKILEADTASALTTEYLCAKIEAPG
ncbi:MAG: class I SAM-dependent methyltransferase [Pseudodesulfovibrio sp.]|uniref:class I SAM-dependent methyltransferase n=1 Tax=Pseudodesulfovibrio sp. TaxID=2035812 RepID=UPI003D0CCAB1